MKPIDSHTMKNTSPILDVHIRKELIARLARKHCGGDTVVVGEFDCPGARADVAVVNGKMHGFEIKSERDTLNRLDSQTPAYGAIFDCVTAVVAPRHLNTVLNQVPSWWGVMEARLSKGAIRLKTVRRAEPNPTIDALAIAKMMWRKEAFNLLRERRLHVGFERAPVMAIWERVAANVPLRIIAREARRAIKARYGSRSVKPLFQNDDSSPTASTVPHRP